jgi:hypothetical protein
MAEESPFIEKEEKAPEKEIDTDGLLKELEGLGISDTKGIQNLQHASQQTGKAWQEVGDLRAEVAQLKQSMSERQAPAQNMDFEGEPIDIRNVVKGAVRDFYVEDVLKPQQQANQQYWNQINEIQGDVDYQNPVIQEMWTKYTNTPNFQQKLQSGQSSMTSEYNKLVRTYYREIATRSHDTIKGLTDKKGKTPYVESGDSRETPAQVPVDERKEAAHKIDKKRREGTVGSADALRDLVNTFLPQNDPIWRQE